MNKEKILSALKHAQDRLNSIPHNYQETDFKLIREAIEGLEAEKSDAYTPDILTSLVAMETTVRELHQDEIDNDHHGDGDEGCLYCALLREAQGVIAKAKGESS